MNISTASTSLDYHITPEMLGSTLGHLSHAAELAATHGYAAVAAGLMEQYQTLAAVAGFDLNPNEATPR